MCTVHLGAPRPCTKGQLDSPLAAVVLWGGEREGAPTQEAGDGVPLYRLTSPRLKLLSLGGTYARFEEPSVRRLRSDADVGEPAQGALVVEGRRERLLDREPPAALLPLRPCHVVRQQRGRQLHVGVPPHMTRPERRDPRVRRRPTGRLALSVPRWRQAALFPLVRGPLPKRALTTSELRWYDGGTSQPLEAS